MGNCNAAQQKEISNKLEEFINNNAVFVFKAEDCAYCSVCTNTLDKQGVAYETTNIEPYRCGWSYLDEIMRREDLKFETVPLIYIGGKFLGDCHALDKLVQSGKLHERVQTAKDELSSRQTKEALRQS